MAATRRGKHIRTSTSFSDGAPLDDDAAIDEEIRRQIENENEDPLPPAADPDFDPSASRPAPPGSDERHPAPRRHVRRRERDGRA